MNKKLIEFFPSGFKPSSSQIDIINRVDAAFSQNNKFCIISAPTGSGKSFVSATLANASKEPSKAFCDLINSYNAYKQDFCGNYQYEYECKEEPPFGSCTLTITKSLQDQYKQLFNEYNVLKGKSNYTCNLDNTSTVDTAPCLLASKIKENCCSNNKCSYYSARNSALLGKHSALNYKMFLHLPGHVKRKNYIICDEASELENELVKMFSLQIDISKLQKLGISVKRPVSLYHEPIKNWIYNLSLNVGDYIEKLIKKTAGDHIMSLSDKNKISFLRNIFWQINQCVEEWTQCEWIIDTPTKDVISIVPLKVNTLSRHIFDYADKIILMSATIVDPKKFAASLGVDRFEYIEVDSSFNPDQSPIYVSQNNCLNYSNKHTVLPKIAKQIVELCESYKNDKGIIHTHSLEITQFLQKYLKGKRFLFRSEVKTNDDILEKHYTSTDPTVLVSPSLTHGIDLKDELARFCIIVKLPYLPLGNKRIKKLFDIDKEWYENQMLNVLIQMCGRSTRSNKDYSNTYILDGTCFKVLPKAKSKLPKFFFSRIN